jgi:hypothetical protein
VWQETSAATDVSLLLVMLYFQDSIEVKENQEVREGGFSSIEEYVNDNIF